MRAIDADALTEELNNSHFPGAPYVDAGISIAIGKVLDAPTIEPKRKTGKWLDAVLPNDNGGLPVEVCDQCNTFFPLAFTGGGLKFCPNCGADMRGENE